MIPTRRRGIEVRERLYEAALAEIEAEGIEDSRVERIVAAAGTSWGTFFRYFPRKQDVLLLFATRHYREHVRPIVDDGLADPSVPRREIARAAVAALARPSRTSRLHAETLLETVRFPLRFAAMLDDGELPVVGLFATLIADAQARGEVRDDVPAPVCATVLAAGTVFSMAPVLRAVAAGQLPERGAEEIGGLAFEAAWRGLDTRGARQ